MTADVDAAAADVRALRAAIICVGLSGVFLGIFVMLVATDAHVGAGLCIGCGIVVAMLGVTPWPVVTMTRPGRILAYWLLAALLVLEVLIPVNTVSARRSTVWHWNEAFRAKLSEQTLRVLERIEKPLYVNTFFVQADPDEKRVFDAVSALLEKYQDANPNIVVEHIDPSRQKDKMVAMKELLGLHDLSRMAPVVFRYGDNRQDVSLTWLIPRPPPGTPEMQPVPEQDMVFHGEGRFTSAILAVTGKGLKTVYFVTNHGELSPDRDLFAFADKLRRANYRVVKFDDLEQGVPPDCTVLVILGPKERLSDRELASIERYLGGAGGKLFYAMGPGGLSGIEPLLGGYGILVGRDLVVDVSKSRQTTFVPVKVPVQAEGHPVATGLREMVLRFDRVRSVEAKSARPDVLGHEYIRAENLLMTRAESWAETDLETYDREGVSRREPADRRGPLGVAAVHEQPDVDFQGTPFPPDTPRTRIVAVGCATFMLPTRLAGRVVPVPASNTRFFYNVIHWLADVRELIAIPPRRWGIREIDKLEDAQRGMLFWWMTAVIPGTFLLFGGVVWLVRRRL